MRICRISRIKYIPQTGPVDKAAKISHGNHRRFDASGTFFAEAGSGTGLVVCAWGGAPPVQPMEGSMDQADCTQSDLF